MSILKANISKEIKAPDGYQANDTIVPVMVTADGVYADAGNGTDGIRVLSGIGKVVGTMTRYATDDGVTATLRDILGTYEIGTMSEDQTLTFAAPDSEERDSLKLHYGLDSAVLEYGLHEDENGNVGSPVFETAAGWGRLGISQNYETHQDPDDEFYSEARKEELRGLSDLFPLFTGSTSVVVTNYKNTENPPARADGMWILALIQARTRIQTRRRIPVLILRRTPVPIRTRWETFGCPRQYPDRIPATAINLLLW